MATKKNDKEPVPQICAAPPNTTSNKAQGVCQICAASPPPSQTPTYEPWIQKLRVQDEHAPIMGTGGCSQRTWTRNEMILVTSTTMTICEAGDGPPT